MATPDEIRARGILRDIYNRHGIEDGTPLEEAVALIEQNAARDGAVPAAWANPEERAAARAEYAARGSNPDEVQKRWEDSIYLMDPQTRQYHQNYARDAEFLDRMKVKDEVSPSVSAWTGPSDNPAGLGQVRAANAVAAWDQTNMNPLYRDSWASSGWAEQEGVGSVLSNLVTNPDLPVGYAMSMGNVPYDFLAMQGSGESPTAGQSLGTAVGTYWTGLNNRLKTPAPILDLPTGASPEDRAKRLAELKQQADAAAVPDSGERWKRTTGMVPPPVVRDTGDAFLATLDGTQFIPGMPAVKGAAGIAKGAARTAARGAARDMATDAATSAAMMGAFSQQPGRTWSQYLGMSPESPDAVTLKTPPQVEEANEARRQQFERTLRAQGVSTADDEAYKRLQAAGKAPIRNR